MRGSFQTSSVSLLALALVLTACEKKAEAPQVPDLAATIPNLILPPGATFVSRPGSADALSLVFWAPDEPDRLVAYYRRFLRPPLWRLVSDGKDNTGAHVLLAEQDGPPLWIRVWPDSTRSGGYVRMTGAVRQLTVDTTTQAGRALKAQQDSMPSVPPKAKGQLAPDSGRKESIR